MQTASIFIKYVKFHLIYYLQSSNVRDLYIHMAVVSLCVATHAVFIQYFSWPQYLTFITILK